MDERDLRVEHRLERLGAEIDTQAPDLRPAVRVRIEHGGAPSIRPGRRPTLAAIAFSLVLLAAGTAYAASADVREAVRDLLGIGAVEIERVPDLEEPEAALDLGHRIESDDAPRALGRPSATFVADVAGQRAVTFIYPPSDDIPPLPTHPSVGLILTQIDGRDPAIVKQVLISASVEPVRINGSRGYWVGGTNHLIEFPEGTSPRTSANALIWTRGPLTLRLEAEIPKAEALRLARTIR
jgi:hypothetical protein